LLSTVQNISFTGLSFVSQAPKLVVAVVLLALALLKVRSNVLHLLLSGILLASLIVGLAIDKDNLVIK
jgi:uncharacterized transporter YbjL